MTIGPIWLMQPIPYFGEGLKGRWIYEPKIDGWRMQIIRYDDGHAECWGRRMERKPHWSGRLPYLIQQAERTLPKGTLIDCELSSSAGRRYIPSLFGRSPKVTPIVFVFDVVYYHNRDLSHSPLKERKRILESLSLPTPFIALLGHAVRNLALHYKNESADGHEGIVVKRINSPYLIGREAPIATDNWRKIK